MKFGYQVLGDAQTMKAKRFTLKKSQSLGETNTGFYYSKQNTREQNIKSLIQIFSSLIIKDPLVQFTKVNWKLT